MPRAHLFIVFCLVLPWLAACGGSMPDAGDPAPGGAGQARTAPPPAATDDVLRSRAEQALQERRLFAPAGDNAIEHYLALRERDGSDARLSGALVDLQPYALIAAERALAAGDVVEAQRLIALLRRIDPDTPALPRLAAGLAGLQERDAVAAPALPAPPPDTVPAATAAAAASTAPSPAVVAAPTDIPDAVPAEPAVAVRTAEPAPAPAEVATPPATATATATAATPATARAPARLPRLVEDVQPRYPWLAMTRRVEGTVQVSFTVGPDGSVLRPRVQSANPPGVFDRSVLEAVSRWRFEATGQSHEMVRSLTFSLPEQTG